MASKYDEHLEEARRYISDGLSYKDVAKKLSEYGSISGAEKWLYSNKDKLGEYKYTDTRQPDEARTRATLHKSAASSPYKFDIMEMLRKTHCDDIAKLLGISQGEKLEWEQGSTTAFFKYDGPEIIDSIPKAIEKSKADLKVWKYTDSRFKTYTTTMKLKETVVDDDGKKVIRHRPIQKTNYLCEVKFTLRETDWEDVAREMIASIEKPSPVISRSGNGVGVVAMSDFHFGAKVEKLIRTRDFNLHVLRGLFKEIAAQINAKGYREVYLCFLGDLLESLTGLNHLNTWKSLMSGGYGHNIIKICYLVMRDFILSIHNVKKVLMVAGNHDRISISSDVDNEGAAAGLLAFFLQENIPDIEIKFNSLALTEEIDGIVYLLSHGHHGASKRDKAKFILDFGDHSKGLFHILLEGHWHTRKATKTKKIVYEDINTVEMDELRYRCLTCPSLFTGNFWSETLGHAGTSGYLEIWNNGQGLPMVLDSTF